MAHVVLHPNFDNLGRKSMPNSRIIAFTAHATKLYTEVEYKPTDILLFGPEPGDIPDPMDIMAGPHVAEQVRLPMRPEPAQPEPHQLRLHRHLRSLAPTRVQGRSVGRKPSGLPSSDAEQVPTGTSEETMSLAEAKSQLPAVREHEVRHCAWKSSLCVDAHSVTIPEKSFIAISRVCR